MANLSYQDFKDVRIGQVLTVTSQYIPVTEVTRLVKFPLSDGEQVKVINRITDGKYSGFDVETSEGKRVFVSYQRLCFNN